MIEWLHGALAGLIGAERTQAFLEAMIRATGWDRSMNLNDIVGERVASVSCERGSPMGKVIWAAQITFDDGSVLDIDAKCRYGDAWLEFEYTEVEAKLDGLK